MNKKNAPSIAKSEKQQLFSTNLSAQRKRLLEALRKADHHGITTFQARHELDIIAPAPRIYELRHDYDFNIQTIRSEEVSPEGHKHIVARYVLFPGSYKGAA